MAVFRRHTTDGLARIEVMLRHADAITQERTARERAGRVGGDDANGEASLAQDGGESVDEGTFTPPGRTSDTKGIRLAKVRKELLHDGRHRRLITFDDRNQSPQRPLGTGEHSLD